MAPLLTLGGGCMVDLPPIGESQMRYSRRAAPGAVRRAETVCAGGCGPVSSGQSAVNPWHAGSRSAR